MVTHTTFQDITIHKPAILFFIYRPEILRQRRIWLPKNDL